MKAVLLRTGSVPVQSPVFSGSPKLRSQISRQDSLTSLQSPLSPRISLHLDHTTGSRRNTSIRRVMSSRDIIRSEAKLSRAGSAARISEEEEEGEKHKWFGLAGAWPRNGINAVEELRSSGDGFGKGKRSGGGGSGWNDGAPSGGDVRKIGEYYKQMLKSNPGDAVLLRNYGKYLHEVEGDVEGAEEYYGRAILASPGDGEVLSLYGKLIWESKGDWERAKTYFDQAVLASPRDCSVLGSYASFIWESEEEEEEEEIMIGKKSTEMQPPVAAMVGAFLWG